MPATDAAAAPGDLDPTFSSDGIVRTEFGIAAQANAMAVQPNGRIVVAGSSAAGGDMDFALIRYRPNGRLDRTFGGDGKVRTRLAGSTDAVNAVAIQADGRIVVAGERSFGMGDSDFVLARYRPNGRLDRSFGGDGLVATAFGAGYESAAAVAIRSNGKIVAAGTSGTDFALARYRPNGAPDPSFSSDGKRTSSILPGADLAAALVLVPGGKVVVAGSSYNGTDYDFGLARYRRNGTLDPTFGVGGTQTAFFGMSNDVGRAMVLQPDGKIVVGGYSLGATIDFALIRFDTSGTPDSSFDGDGKVVTPIGTSLDDLFALAVQRDGRIVAAGQTFETTGAFALTRYRRNGSLDLTFGEDGKVTTPVGAGQAYARAVAVLPNGRLLAAGPSVGTPNRFALLRYLRSFPEVSVGNERRAEGDSGMRTFRFPVRLSVPPGQSPVYVLFRTVEGSAVVPQDYRFELGRLRFIGARVLRGIRVEVVGDRQQEPNERFKVRITAPNAALGRAPGRGTIRNDD